MSAARGHTGASAGRIRVLLIESSSGEAGLFERALAAYEDRHELHCAANGAEAMEFLRRHGRHRRAPRPDLVLLDLDLTGTDGLQLLAELKADAALRRIPVVVLASSTDAGDVAAPYDLHASAYVVKAADRDGLAALVEALAGFWLSVVRYSPRE